MISLLEKYMLSSDRLALLVAFRLFPPLIVCVIIRLFAPESADVPLARLINAVDIYMHARCIVLFDFFACCPNRLFDSPESLLLSSFQISSLNISESPSLDISLCRGNRLELVTACHVLVRSVPRLACLLNVDG
jgi:hypothetical protein